jgi:hypothetical protein
MLYSEIVANGWVLPRKQKYTVKDVDLVQADSLFGRFGPNTLSARQSAFIVKCSAVYWNTDYSQAVATI